MPYFYVSEIQIIDFMNDCPEIPDLGTICFIWEYDDIRTACL